MTYQPSPQGWSSDNISCVSNLSLGHRLQGLRQGILWSSFVFQVKLTCETKCLLLPLPPISQIISPKAPTLRESSFTFFGGTWLALEKLEGASTMNINFAVYCRQIYMVSLWCSLEVWPQSISVVTKLNTLCLQLRIFGPEKILWTKVKIFWLNGVFLTNNIYYNFGIFGPPNGDPVVMLIEYRS